MPIAAMGWTERKVEEALDDEAVRTECYMLADENNPEFTAKGIAVLDLPLSEYEQWFREVVLHHMDKKATDLLEEEFGLDEDEHWTDEMFDSIYVNAQVVAGPGGYLPAGSPAYKAAESDYVLAESAYEGESDVSVPTDDEEFMEVLEVVVGHLSPVTDAVPWMHHVMWTAYLPEED